MNHGSLFSGIGGFEEGARLAGIPTLWNCEYEIFQRGILKKHYPGSKQYEDIRTAIIRERVDIISGGFPCQDISSAGKMEGIKGSRSGLWAEMYRICREIRPKYIIIENSPNLTIRGFERVLCDLSEIRYYVEWQCISNHAFGYPHERERLYVIAYSNEIGLQSNIRQQGTFRSVFKKWTPSPDDGYFMSQRIHKIRPSEVIRNGNGFQSWTHRVGSIGNAVNPTIAYYLFDCIISHNKQYENQ
jgi:DNA (cytosine-5)-methyltransferase 1